MVMLLLTVIGVDGRDDGGRVASVQRRRRLLLVDDGRVLGVTCSAAARRLAQLATY